MEHEWRKYGLIFQKISSKNFTKTIAQINDCLFIYMKFKAMYTMPFNMSSISFDAQNGSFVHVAYFITDQL